MYIYEHPFRFLRFQTTFIAEKSYSLIILALETSWFEVRGFTITNNTTPDMIAEKCLIHSKLKCKELEKKCVCLTRMLYFVCYKFFFERELNDYWKSNKIDVLNTYHATTLCQNEKTSTSNLQENLIKETALFVLLIYGVIKRIHQHDAEISTTQTLTFCSGSLSY